MAAPMRNAPLDSGHRAKVADPRAAAVAAAKAEPATSNNFEYDDNEWDIGIGDLIIDLDADIEKTNEKNGGAGAAGAVGAGGGGMASATGGGKGGKMAVEHSATVDKGLKMKIKRTKPGTKTSEAKHEIVKSGELNGGEAASPGAADGGKGKHPLPAGGGGGGSAAVNSGAGGGGGGGGSKRGSSGHRRDKARDKHGADKAAAKPPSSPGSAPPAAPTTASVVVGAAAAAAAAVPAPVSVTVSVPVPVPVPVPVQPPAVVPDVNGVVRTPVSSALLGQPAQQTPPTVTQVSLQQQSPQQTAQQTEPLQQQQQQQQQQQRLVFPVSSGPGPPNAPGPPAASPVKIEPPSTPEPAPDAAVPEDDPSASPPAKKAKVAEPKDMLDVCVGTSVGTITEPDCLGPCEPGTSVTLEGIVWHETEGGVLVVNVTWRGKTYVGTLLDCTRHDWAPPRFCDSPTSDLDARLPKGRGKRGRAAANSSPSSDLSNFTETRSSVHSKLRNGSGKGRRGGSTSGSPTPFVPPRPEPSGKRKGRTPEDEAQSPTSNGKKSRSASNPPSSTPNSNSPPSSPILLECPEPNCCKKYKHINGLKYHQSHAHGSTEDEDTKDAASMSENDESNVEAPSPATPVKSPEKVPEPPPTQPSTPQAQAPQPKEIVTPPPPPQPVAAATSPPLVPVVVQQQQLPEQLPTCRPATPSPPPPQPAALPVQVQTPTSLPPPTPPEMMPPGPLPSPETKTVVKPGVLRYGPPVEDYSTNSMYCTNKPVLTPLPAAVVSTCSPVSTIRTVNVAVASSQPPQQLSPQPSSVPVQPAPTVPQLQPMPLPLLQLPQAAKAPPPQFKVKPTAALMPDDKKERSKLSSHKKKNRKSPAGSPHPQPEQPAFGLDATGRDDVQSPAYSDISDDAAPVLDSEMGDGKGKAPGVDKKSEVGQGPSPHTMPHYGMYPFHYGQPPYLVPSVPQHDGKPKEACEKVSDGKLGDKDKKETSGEYSQKLLQQHYYPYGYVSGYPYNLEPSYPVTVVPSDEKNKDHMGKDDKSPSPIDQHMKPMPHIPSPIQVPNPSKVKTEPGLGMKEKHQNENHQILKESIEMKSQMSSYMYSRQQQQHQHQHQQQQQEDLRHYYLYPEQQRRKESQGVVEQVQKPLSIPSKPTLPSPSHKHKDKLQECKKEEKLVKQEGVKPTMETQGPPPPPTSQYAYIHPSYMQSPHYGALPFDPSHPMYRSINPMLVPGPYGANPYLHPQLPRYHAPEDLSRPPSGPTKALDLLQHHASQYYSNHKIHELQERALKSPTPKAATASASPSGVVGGSNMTGAPGPVGPQGHSPVVQSGPTAIPSSGKQQSQVIAGDGKEARSPPPQRHVHTHHHTHVGLGYPILASQYPAPYGAAVLATQQAAAVAASVINPYPPK